MPDLEAPAPTPEFIAAARYVAAEAFGTLDLLDEWLKGVGPDDYDRESIATLAVLGDDGTTELGISYDPDLFVRLIEMNMDGA